jgi:homoserine O-acetyltransferase
MASILQYYHPPEPLITECGDSINLTIAYATYGTLNSEKSNAVWVCHALTANALVHDWWPGFIDDEGVISTRDHYIVCANIIGSCYGTTGPLSIDDKNGKLYLHHFPLITIRDMVKAHTLLRKHLGVEKICLLAGGSMGGYQVLEWALSEPTIIERLLLLATSAAESPWGIAIHEAQRMAIEADSTWRSRQKDGGVAGLKAARAIGMLTYRNYASFAAHQADKDTERIDGFRAASYQQHQGAKLAKRFNAYSYWTLTKAMDTHNIARGRAGSTQEALKLIVQPSLIIGISSDILCPVQEQRLLAAGITDATLIEIDSPYGHDGFLVEVQTIRESLYKWLKF